MADTATLPATTTREMKNKTPAYQLPGAMGQYEEDLERVEGGERLGKGISLEQLLTLPEHKILGSISFNTVKNTLADTGEAVADLARLITGAGTEIPGPVVRTEKPIYGEGNSELVQAQASAIEQEANEQKIEAEQRRIIENTIPLEVFQRLADEALMKEGERVAGGPLTDEDEKLVGLRREQLLTIASIHWVSRKRGEAKVVVEERQEEVEKSEVQQRIYGADIKRTFEDHNMNQPG